MVNEYIQKVQRAYEQSQIFPIVTEVELRSSHNIFMADDFMTSLRDGIKDYRHQERLDCAQAFRTYEKYVIEKFETEKTKLNVV
jgi:hypothetical protein